MTDDDTDATFFDRHPNRRYRLRFGWAIRWRKSQNVFLRSPLPGNIGLPNLGGDEGTAERLWWLSAYPDASPEWRAEMAREARPKPPSKTRRGKHG
jgi:hypothetical protein